MVYIQQAGLIYAETLQLVRLLRPVRPTAGISRRKALSARETGSRGRPEAI